MVNLMDIIKRRDKIKNARDYLLDEIGSQTETVLLTDEEVKMIADALTEALRYYENFLSSISIPDKY